MTSTRSEHKNFLMHAKCRDFTNFDVADNVIRGSKIMTDECNAYTRLNANYEHEVVNHQIEYSTIDGVNENQAESYFSRLRRYVFGIAHNSRPKYLADIAWEMAWREDVRAHEAWLSPTASGTRSVASARQRLLLQFGCRAQAIALPDAAVHPANALDASATTSELRGS